MERTNLKRMTKAAMEGRLAKKTTLRPKSKRYPWRTLNVGSSFYLSPGSSELLAKQYCSLWSTKLGRRFIYLMEGDRPKIYRTYP